VEQHGVVDGIYRLSGVSSNIQRLRQEFDSDRCPDLQKDVYLQDIHCVSSLCKAYFRELPNPLLTYQLYDKFADAVAIQMEEARLVKIKDVLKELPVPHYR
ncbi:RHG30 protein, partial [Circaetus pectoralis]|nr:RHG30 protein [Circaetus pectoralis]